MKYILWDSSKSPERYFVSFGNFINPIVQTTKSERATKMTLKQVEEAAKKLSSNWLIKTISL